MKDWAIALVAAVCVTVPVMLAVFSVMPFLRWWLI